jgi:formiminoglutamase
LLHQQNSSIESKNIFAMTESFLFSPSTLEIIQANTTVRSGETRLGQTVKEFSNQDGCNYVILGIEESFGPQLNQGLPGAEKAFSAFLNRFLNIQSNRFLDGNDILIAGTIHVNPSSSNEHPTVEELDELVTETLQPFLTKGMIPLIIGGGHNNALPIIRAFHQSSGSSIGVINMDPHGDCRTTDFRHSGNSFSFGLEEKIIHYYSVIGLHPQYNNRFILDFLNRKECVYSLFDDYLVGKRDLLTDVYSEKSHLESLGKYGIELDMDGITGMPSSAFTPSGFSLNEARMFVKTLANSANCTYLHLPEGAPTSEHENKIVGKALSYLVWDFIHEHKKSKL